MDRDGVEVEDSTKVTAKPGSVNEALALAVDPAELDHKRIGHLRDETRVAGA